MRINRLALGLVAGPVAIATGLALTYVGSRLLGIGPLGAHVLARRQPRMWRLPAGEGWGVLAEPDSQKRLFLTDEDSGQRTGVWSTRAVIELGCVIEDAEPDFAGVGEAFPVLRYASNHTRYSTARRREAQLGERPIKFEVAQAERSREPRSGARWRGRRGCTSRASSSLNGTTTSSFPSRRWSRSTSRCRIRRR